VILADTSVWIDFLRQSDPSINDRMLLHLEEGDLIAVSAVFGELLQGVRNAYEYKTIIEFWQDIPKVDEADLFIEAGKLSAKHKLFSFGIGLIDSYILSAVLINGHELWTLDKNLLGIYNKLS
jgi:predicted nucleic acid-binding protein